MLFKHWLMMLPGLSAVDMSVASSVTSALMAACCAPAVKLSQSYDPRACTFSLTCCLTVAAAPILKLCMQIKPYLGGDVGWVQGLYGAGDGVRQLLRSHTRVSTSGLQGSTGGHGCVQSRGRTASIKARCTLRKSKRRH
jgi:hypothetical protein